MLVEAANWNPQCPNLSHAEVLARHESRHYIDGWPQPRDLGVIAEGEHGERIGAAWSRFFTAQDPGYGYRSEDIPEVAIAVVKSHRGQGVGNRLLNDLEALARQHGYNTLSLSVEPTNPAARLYRKRGYVPMEGTGGSQTMRLDL
jgi:GNAT superfamily N-acetyltransferase